METVVTSRSIMHEGWPVLLVSRYPDDEGWAFLDGGPFDFAEALLVQVESVLRLDATLAEILDLPEGWSAQRGHVGGNWERFLDLEMQE